MCPSCAALPSFSFSLTFSPFFALSWLRSDLSYFKRREFAFTTFEEMYTRYHSFGDVAAFKKEMLYDTKRDTRSGYEDILPAKVHVGAVYSHPPKDHAAVMEDQFVPVEKELVFDIDANDYDDIRFCPCRGTPAVCMICWGLMENAMQVIDSCLREDFGFHHICWVFSGRRGVHGWVCDSKARTLTSKGRSAVASYIHVATDVNRENVQKNFDNWHPALRRSYERILKPYFENLVKEHALLMDEKAVEKVYELTNAVKPGAAAELRRIWEEKDALNTSASRWELLCSWAKTEERAKVPTLLRHLPAVVIFHFSYPRLDIQVSMQWSHLLKAPMTVHPSTGMVCVPISAEPLTARTGFNPTTCPRLHEVQQEIDHYVEKAGLETEQALRRSSLAPSLHILEQFVADLAKDRRRQRLNDTNNANTFSF